MMVVCASDNGDYMVCEMMMMVVVVILMAVMKMLMIIINFEMIHMLMIDNLNCKISARLLSSSYVYA
jgi:hypothetical protein